MRTSNPVFGLFYPGRVSLSIVPAAGIAYSRVSGAIEPTDTPNGRPRPCNYEALRINYLQIFRPGSRFRPGTPLAGWSGPVTIRMTTAVRHGLRWSTRSRGGPTMSMHECFAQFLLILIPVVVLSLINSRRSH